MEKVSSERDSACGFIRGDFAWSAIERVSHNRMSQRRQMDADLMCPARLDPYFQKRELTVDAVNLIDHLPVRDGFTAIATTGGHTVAPDQITADWSVDCSFRLLHRAMYERNVRPPVVAMAVKPSRTGR